jgi:hypothetical protein
MQYMHVLATTLSCSQFVNFLCQQLHVVAAAVHQACEHKQCRIMRICWSAVVLVWLGCILVVVVVATIAYASSFVVTCRRCVWRAPAVV